MWKDMEGCGWILNLRKCDFRNADSEINIWRSS